VTSRNVGVSLQRELQRQSSQEAVLAFVTISHEDITDPIRVVTDTKDFVYDGYTWTGFWFDIQILSDNERPPETRIRVANVDRKVGSALKAIVSPARFKIELLPLSDFDTTVEPRTLISSANVAYTADHLYLIDIESDDLEVTGRIVSWNYVQELWPGVRATQARCPGLYR